MASQRRFWFIGGGVLGGIAAMGAALAIFMSFGAVSPAPTADGINVSGWWTIDVKNADGSVASHTEFENSLLSFGSESLARFVSRQSMVGYWIVQLGTDGTAVPPSERPCLDAGNPSVCAITEPSSASAGLPYALNDNLQVGLVGSGAAAVARLSGSTTAQKDGKINWVVTSVGNCPYPYYPGYYCYDDNGNSPEILFTNQIISTPISILNGQTIFVQVDFSFH